MGPEFHRDGVLVQKPEAEHDEAQRITAEALCIERSVELNLVDQPFCEQAFTEPGCLRGHGAAGRRGWHRRDVAQGRCLLGMGIARPTG